MIFGFSVAATKPLLKSSSHGVGSNRYLVISKRFPFEIIAEEILLRNNNNFKQKYLIKVPEALKDQFPNYTNTF